MTSFNTIKESFRKEESQILNKYIENLLREVIEEKIKLSYHPLGFLYKKIFERDSETLRLHIWNDLDLHQNDDLLIHNHVFNIHSYVYHGNICNITYDVTQCKFADKACLETYSVSYKRNKSILTKLSYGHKILNENKQVVENEEFYQVHRDVFHKSEKLDRGLPITLVYTSDHSDKSPLVISENSTSNDEISFERKNISEDSRNYLLNKLKSLI